jgi:hypothetical protein
MNGKCALPIAALLVWAPFAAAAGFGAVGARGHAHNDYRHERPLLDALDHDFVSVEADIHLVGTQLLVAHDLKDVAPERTLEALYFEPLQRRVRENGGKVYPWLDEFILLVDIKSNGETTYQALKPVLEKYRDMLTAVTDGVEQKGPVTVILSGDYPLETVAAESTRLVAVDGRPHHLGKGYPVHLMPLISSSWHGQFKWYGVGPIPEDIRNSLHDLVRRIHDEGRIARFWATPDRTEAWDEEVAAGVDLINADNLGKLREYLQQKNR